VGFRDDAPLDTSQVEDVRGSTGLGRVPGGGLTVGGGGLGLLAAVIVGLLFGVNVLGGGGGLGSLSGLDDATLGTPRADNTELAASCRTGADANRREDCRVVAYVNSIQAYWQAAFARSGRTYPIAKTRFFTGEIATGCGPATSDVGPFYCPADKYVYIDLGFFNDLRTKFGAQGGPFAQGYVLAHEYGHHVQDVLGILGGGSGGQGAQSRSVRTELQADCFAGVWTHNAVSTGYLNQLTQADIADSMDAAAAVGDDRIQGEFQGRVTPETWTHGSSAQRQHWFTVGYQTGDAGACDTFKGTI
jgi:predicted metalloprotease